ncbi:hypothetical protein RB195_024946 [Necator americanus]|uniref:Uncharacterized protein n=1 Tax=Necator americanus TaxID=51031 RepID=A0ABR1EQ99_NECAM
MRLPRIADRRRFKIWIVHAHANTISDIPSQQAAIVGIDAFHTQEESLTPPAYVAKDNLFNTRRALPAEVPEESPGVQHQPKLDMASLKDEEFRKKSLRDPQRESGQPIELVDEFCYLGCTLKNDGSYERDIQQRCTKANSTVNSLTKCLWSTLIANEVKPGCLPIRNFPYHDVGIGDLGSAVDGDGEAGLHGERELFRRLLSTFRPMVWCNEELYSEVHMMCRQMTRGKHQHLARLSEVFTGNRLRFSGHVMRRPCDRLGHVVLRMIQTQTGKALLVVKECFRGDDEGRSEDTWR